MTLAVRVFDSRALFMTQYSWYDKENSQIALSDVPLLSGMCVPRVKKWVSEINIAVVDKVPGRV